MILKFILNGRSPNRKYEGPFAAIVRKATEEVPGDRYDDAIVLSKAFQDMKKVVFAPPDTPKTVAELLARGDKNVNWQVFHHVATTQELDSNFDAFLFPTNFILLQEGAIRNYYEIVGEEIGKFVEVYKVALAKLGGYWNFDNASDFGKVMNGIFYVTKNNTTKLSCALEMWVWAYYRDRWNTQSLVNELLQHIPSTIEHDFAAEILAMDGTLTNGEQLRGVTMSPVIRNAVNRVLERK